MLSRCSRIVPEAVIETVAIALNSLSLRLDVTRAARMNLPQRIRDHFPDATFGHPCSQSDVTRAEQALGEQLPKMLRELYLAFDGFRMPEGGGLDALLPLFGREGLVGMNAFFRNGAEFPTKLVSQCLFFGNDGIGGSSGACQAKSFAGTHSGARTSRSTATPPSMHGLPRGESTKRLKELK